LQEFWCGLEKGRVRPRTTATAPSGAAAELDERHEALAGCLKKLAARDRELVLTRYEPGSGVAEAARRSGRSMDAAYKALNRLRKLLHDCVTNELANPHPGGAA
jgi:DNA-directed RNA polymerase specialized sigma24 family protein